MLLRRAEARRGPTIHHDYWWSVARPLMQSTPTAAAHLGAAVVAIPHWLNLSHNTAFTCSEDGQRVVAYGGRRKHLYFRDVRINERGVHRVEGRVIRQPGLGGGSLSVEWSTPRLVLDGSSSSGCVERRSRVGPSCEFDGKLSVVRWQGRTWLFARANVAECGGRHVQVTWSADGVSGWARWQLLQFCEGSVPLGASASNIYFFAVRPLGDRLVAFFPAVLSRRGTQQAPEGGLYASTSEDGIEWRRPERLIASRVLPEWRTADYPVDGGGMWADEAGHPGVGHPGAGHPGAGHAPLSASLLVEQAVVMEHGKALAGCARPASLCAYNVSLPPSLTEVRRGKARACGGSERGRRWHEQCER